MAQGCPGNAAMGMAQGWESHSAAPGMLPWEWHSAVLECCSLLHGPGCCCTYLPSPREGVPATAGWNVMSFQVPPNPNHPDSVILQFCEKE